MNLDHLTYFKTLVELGSRSETAERLSITPSTLSLALSKLEQEVGVPLIQKKRGSVELTSEGEAFYEYVETSLRFLNNGLKLLQEKRGGGRSKRNRYWCGVLCPEQRLVAHYQPVSTENPWRRSRQGGSVLNPFLDRGHQEGERRCGVRGHNGKR